MNDDEAKVPYRYVGPVMQPWTQQISMMQQTVLLTAVRGPDGLPKYHVVKYLLRWYRRCILLDAINHTIIASPAERGGGSFTGPSTPDSQRPWQEGMDEHLAHYLQSLDEVPHHFQLHFMHGIEILGYKHPTETTRLWWQKMYFRLVYDMHLFPETEQQLDERLGDNYEGWIKRADPATQS